jgi:hypothetical protein
MCGESKFTVFFDDPFWVGVYERTDGDNLEAARIVFGPEPKDYEVYDFMLKNFYNLRFSPPVEVDKAIARRANPKRVQRQINNQLSQKGIGTKAQQALKLQQEEGKKERRQITKQMRQAEEKRMFDLKQQQKKEKHKGR